MKLISLLNNQILNQCLNRFSSSSCSLNNSLPKINQRKCFSTATTTSGALSLAHTKIDNTNVNSSTPPILILHGLFGSKQNWKSLSKVFASKTNPLRKVYALDARNHGDSPHSQDNSYDDLASDIAKFHQDHQITKSIIIGHSMGGRAMMCFALKYPELVEKAIIIDISPVSRNKDEQSSLVTLGSGLAALQQLQLDKSMSLVVGRKAADKLLMPAFPGKTTRDFILLNLQKGDDGSFFWRMNVDGLHKNFHHISKFPDHLTDHQFVGPALFIAGSKSDFVHPSDLSSIQKIFPNSRLEFLDAGHLVHMEKPIEFTSLVLDFIND